MRRSKLNRRILCYLKNIKSIYKNKGNGMENSLDEYIKEDVIKAIDIFSKESLNILSQGNFSYIQRSKLPAKHIRGAAYKVAYGKDIRKVIMAVG